MTPQLRVGDGEAVEVIVRLDDDVLDVRYVGIGERFCTGWSQPPELVHVEADGRVVVADAPELGRARLDVTTTTAPQRRALRPRFDWAASGSIGIALLMLAFCFLAAAAAVAPRTRSLVLDDGVVRRVHLEPRPEAKRTPTPTPTPAKTEPKRVAVHTNPFATGQTWTGSYYCPQGTTALSLRIERVSGNEVRARYDFDFGPGIAVGSYELGGRFELERGHATFEPGAWILRPSGYYAVGLGGFVSATEYRGEIVHAGCGGFELHLAK